MREAGAARWFLAGVVALAIAGTFGAILFAFEISAFVAGADFANLQLGLLGGALRAVTFFGQEWLASTAASRAKIQLRRRLLNKFLASPRTWREKQSTDQVTWLLTSGLDALDSYFAKFLPQVIYTALAIPIFVATVASQDALSSVIMVVTIPLIPLFMVFIGWATQRVQARQVSATTQLSSYLGEVIRGVLTFRVFSRAEHQAKNLDLLSQKHRKETLRVLSVSFLSGFAMELIASLSVALMAVSIGLRLLSGEMDYRAGLFILLLAPDAYLPLRMIGANFHASSEGVAAIRQTMDLLDTEVSEIGSQNIDVAPGKMTLLVGPSGSGKSTALEALIGDNTSWMPQKSVILPGSVASNIAGFGEINTVHLARSMSLACLDDVDSTIELTELNTALSGGQAQRVGLARAIYRVLNSRVDILLLDEPLSAQDAQRAHQIVDNLSQLVASGLTILVASHQSHFDGVADKKVKFEL